MATVGLQDVNCRIVEERILKLETEAGRTPGYNGVVMIDGMLLVVDSRASTVELYNSRDGKRITSHRLKDGPWDVCLINNEEVAVCLLNGTVAILSLRSRHGVKLVKTLQSGFICCSLSKWSSDKLVVSGQKGGMLCWGILSITDGSLDSTHYICKGWWTNVAVKENTVYISCRTFDSITNGVHAFHLSNPNKQKFLYRHQELNPWSIMVDKHYVYVCDLDSNRIHQLTDSGQLVTIHTVSSALDKILYDDQQGLLYTTSKDSNVITVYKMESLHQPGLPIEIMKMDDRSIQLFEEALKDGKETVHSIRIMVVGHMGVGKTTLVKRLLGEEVNISERHTTEGIDVYVNCCDVSLSTHEWTRRSKDSGQDYRLQRIAKVLNEQYSVAESFKDSHAAVKDQNAEVLHHHSSDKDIDQDILSASNQQEESTAHEREESTAHEQEESTTYQKEESTAHQQEEFTSHQQEESTANEPEESTAYQKEESTAHQQEESTAHQQEEFTSHQQEESTAHEPEESTAYQQEESTAHQQEKFTVHELDESTSHEQEESSSAVVQTKSTQAKANTIAMIKLLKENVNKKEGSGENSLLTIWDFAGQYAFYTTHQTFLTRRAIYLLVSDVSGQVTDLVADDCYFDSKGRMKCQVHELVEVWLNSIHSCAESPEADSPPVILVGTHVDKISQKLVPVKVKVSETQNATSKAVEFNLSTTTTPAAISANEQTLASTLFGAVMKFVYPRKTGEILEVTTVPSLAGAHAVPADENLKKHKKWSWLPGRKKKEKITVTSPPSTHEPVRETVMGVDAESDENHEICKRYFSEIRSYLKDKPTRFHLIDEDFAIDNTVVDRKLEDLKRKIVEVASQQPYWGEQIPARWLTLEQELMRIKAAGWKVISHEKVEKINKKGTVPIQKSEELDLFLRYLHETGTIIYFSIDILRKNIVLDPTWLIDALKTLINAQPDLPEGSADNAVLQKWSDFKGKGILSSELIDAVWTKEKYPELHAHKEHMLLIMEQLNIIAKPRAFSEIREKDESYFLTPCMLRQESPREIISSEQDPMLVSTPVLCLVFTGKFLPPPIFHRLIAACITRWPVAKKKETTDHLIFCGCCVFDLDLFHRLTLHCKNHIVFARITRLVVDEVKTPDDMLCTRVRKFITLNLSKITSYLGQNLKYELSTWWSPSQVFSNDGSAVPFQMWFADEGHDYDAPISPEHMNHARLYVALVTVCTNALRDILLNHVPYTNIYKAIKAKKADLTKKTQTRQGQWHNALLLPDQCKVVFPDPRDRYVASVDQFDISLLYILIRNVSSVSASLTGWGIDPLEQPFRDKCLGASVERIRSYRNQIGHSMDGKMSQQDFDHYWNKIDAVLDDIEQELGRQGYYRSQLDKQKRQVISVYEAC